MTATEARRAIYAAALATDLYVVDEVTREDTLDLLDDVLDELRRWGTA